MRLTLYTFEDPLGAEDTFTTTDPKEAEARALVYGLRCIAWDLEPTDSEVAWDYTPAGRATASVHARGGS